MKRHPLHADVSVPQSVTEFIKLSTGRHSTQIGFSDQRISPHAGLAPFVAFLHWAKIPALLAAALPHAPTSNNASNPGDTALAFLVGILLGAKKLAQVAHLRADHALGRLLGAAR